jgi:phage replication O-like protein O
VAAQLEDGYTLLAHEIIESLYKSRINGTQANIILFVIRYTYGFHRKCHELGNAFIADGTGIRKDTIKKEVNRLIEMKILRVFEEATHVKSRVLGINTDTSKWQTDTKHPQGGKTTPGVQEPPTVGGNNTPPPGGQLPPQEIYSFKNNFKDISTTTGEPEMTVMDAYEKVFGDMFMTGLIQGYVHQIQQKGYGDNFIIELFLETGESSTKPNLRLLKAIGDRWMEEGITSRAEAKQRKAGGGASGVNRRSGTRPAQANREDANRKQERFRGGKTDSVSREVVESITSFE